MPIYEYRCANCGFEKEYLQKLSDPAITDCPECGHPSMVKLVSAAGFQLKGTGWYATDFKNGTRPEAGKEKGAAKDKKEPESKDSGGDSKSSPADAAPACGAGACPACQ
jgi:putative FmdB family regulatory protein